MLQRFASTSFMVGALLTALIPAAGLARDHDGNRGGNHGGSYSGGHNGGHNDNYGGGRGFSSGSPGRTGGNSGQGFSGESRNYAPRGFSGGQNFASPPREYSRGPGYDRRGYGAPRSYGQPGYGGYYPGSLYLGYAGPAYSGYAYDPGYSYPPPNAPQACASGAYDRYGNWIPGPNCYSGQPQYPPQQLNSYPNQSQYPPQPPNYGPSQQQYPQPPQDYDPNPQQQYNR